MAVLTKTDEACILNHERAIAEAYKSCVVNSYLIERQKSDVEQTDCELRATFLSTKPDHFCFKNVKPSIAAAHPFTPHLTVDTSKTSLANIKSSYQFKQGFFCVKVPYMMDTQFTILSRHFADVKKNEEIKLKDVQQVLSDKRKRKKKRTESNKLKVDEDWLLKIQTAMQKTGKELGVFQSHISEELDNNVLSRQLALLDYEPDACASLLLREDGSPVPCSSRVADPLMICGPNSHRITPSDLIHRRVVNLCDHATVINAHGTKYVLPAHSTLLLSNLDSFYSHLWKELEVLKYDLVVLDPPWENKSVKRKRSYSMMDENELCHIPLGSLMCPGSLVALWITNNQRLEDFAHNTLFPAWSVRPVAKWFWLKVTQTGDFISNMDCGHKKPYEVLLLGQHQAEQKTDDGGRCASLPEKFVMVSVPCSLHSKKPPLQEILTEYLPPRPRCLELFARNLNPGWTSWGREALKHQNLIYFEEVACSD